MLIAVHSTRGFNRTGFLICAFLIKKFNLTVETALSLFAEARPPGIYKKNHFQKLFELFGDPEEAPSPPAKPNWNKTVEEKDEETGEEEIDERKKDDKHNEKLDKPDWWNWNETVSSHAVGQ